MKKIYLDNSATTKIRPEALEKYISVSEEHYGNPSSLHAEGFAAERELQAARSAILKTVGGDKCKLIFTSSGTEANNLAILGRAFAKERFRHGSKLITTLGEHASVNEPFARLKDLGFKLGYIPTPEGQLDFEALERELTPDTVLVSVMMVNNETGAVYDLVRLSRTVKARCPDALIHVDATQGYMKIPFTVSAIGADLVTLSSHKIEGPKGVGALVVTDECIQKKALSPLTLGGGQEMGLRSGTENVPAIAAFGVAASLSHETLREDIAKMQSLRSRLIERLKEQSLSEIKPVLPKYHAPHILNLTLPGIKSETMLHFLSSRGIFVSSGSACSSNSTAHLSTALTAFGRTPDEADSSIRISFSHRNTEEDVDALCEALCEGLSRLARKRG